MGNKKGFVVPTALLLLLFTGSVFLLGLLLGRSVGQNDYPELVNGLIWGGSFQAEKALLAEGSQPASPSASVITHGPRDQKKIALTFDAEMTYGMKRAFLSGKVKSLYDSRIIDTLRLTKTKATFFLTGMWIELFPKETYDLSTDALFELGSHSYTDSSFEGYCYGLDRVPDTLLVEEIGSTEKLFRKYAGIDNRLFRFPGGCYNQHALDLVHQANDQVVHWDVNGNDGFNNNSSAIVGNVVTKVQNGSIIILHLNGPPTAPKTAEALPVIISRLKEKGYEFMKVNELLGMPPELRVPKN